MKKMNRRRRLNDKGLSLVEVIIAVVILTIVIIPTLRMFATSFEYNSKSRKRQRAVTVGESVMESFKAYDVEELCRQFGAGTGGTPFKGVYVDSQTTRVVKAYQGASPTPLSDVLVDNKLNPVADRIEFDLGKVKTENANDRYDVKIMVSPKENKQVLKVDKNNAYNDAVIQISQDLEYYVYDTLREEIRANELAAIHPSDIASGTIVAFRAESGTIKSVKFSNVARTIQITGSGSQVSLGIQYTCTGEFYYQYTDTSGTVKSGQSSFADKVVSVPMVYAEGKVSADASGNTTLAVYDSAVTGGSLKNIYLYYYPLYKDCDPMNQVSATGGSSSDTIQFAGAFSGTVDAYVIKQKMNGPSTAKMNQYEGAYDLTVRGLSSLNLRHNLSALMKDCSTAPPAPSISGFHEEKPLKTTYNPSDGSVNEQSGLDKSQNLIYDITVTVYNEGTSNAVATFAGTMND